MDTMRSARRGNWSPNVKCNGYRSGQLASDRNARPVEGAGGVVPACCFYASERKRRPSTERISVRDVTWLTTTYFLDTAACRPLVVVPSSSVPVPRGVGRRSETGAPLRRQGGPRLWAGPRPLFHLFRWTLPPSSSSMGLIGEEPILSFILATATSAETFLWLFPLLFLRRFSKEEVKASSRP